MKIGIIHLSDIHFQEDEKQNSILEKQENIFDSIKNNILDFDKIFIAISGDIAFSGKKEEYNIARNFLNIIKNKIESYSKKNISIVGVPGNHDLNFENNQKARELIIAGLKHQNFSDIDPDLIMQCCKPQTEFFEFQEEIFLKNNNILFNNKLLKVIEFQFDDYNVVFNCFNTSWTSKKSEQETIDFPTDYFYTDVFDNPATIKLNLIHHPLNWHSGLSHRKFKHFLNMQGDITLSGHEHVADLTKMIDVNNNSNMYIESAALQETGNTEKSYFNLIAIDIKKNSIRVENFSYNNGKYNKKEILKEKSFLDYDNKPNIEQPLNLQFSNYLDSLSAQFLHSRVDELLIDDLFISPYLRTSKKNSDRIKLVEFEKVLDVKTLKKAIIIGDEISGKTTLCKKIYKEFHKKSFLPIYIKGLDIKKPTFKFILNKLIKNCYIDQYHKKAIKNFEEIDKNKFVLIIDDFNACKLKDEHRNTFIKNVNDNFEHVIISSDSILYTLEILNLN